MLIFAAASQIGQGRDEHTLAIVHEDGTTISYLYIAPWIWFRASYLTSYDENQQPFDYY